MDIIKRAEAALNSPHWSWSGVAKKFIPELIDALKAARAETEQLKAQNRVAFGGMYSGGSDV